MKAASHLERQQESDRKMRCASPGRLVIPISPQDARPHCVPVSRLDAALAFLRPLRGHCINHPNLHVPIKNLRTFGLQRDGA